MKNEYVTLCGWLIAACTILLALMLCGKDALLPIVAIVLGRKQL